MNSINYITLNSVIYSDLSNLTIDSSNLENDREKGAKIFTFEQMSLILTVFTVIAIALYLIDSKRSASNSTMLCAG